MLAARMIMITRLLEMFQYLQFPVKPLRPASDYNFDSYISIVPRVVINRCKKKDERKGGGPGGGQA
jgi:hypothetical protein